MPPSATNAVDRDNVLVVELRRCLGFVLEPLKLLGVEGGGERQHLQSHTPVQRDLVRLVNDPHAAPADLPNDAVVAEATQHPGFPHQGVVQFNGFRRLDTQHLQRGQEPAHSGSRVATARLNLVFPVRRR